MMLGEHKHLMTQWHTVSKWRRRITEEIHRPGNVGGLNFPAVTTERKYSTDYYSRGCCNWIHKHTTHTCLATVISWTWIRNPSPSCNQITLHPLSQQLHSHDVPGLPAHDRIKAFSTLTMSRLGLLFPDQLFPTSVSRRYRKLNPCYARWQDTASKSY